MKDLVTREAQTVTNIFSGDPIQELNRIKHKRSHAEQRHAADCISLPLTTAINNYLATRENINTRLSHHCDLNQFSEYLNLNGINYLGDIGTIPAYEMKALCEGWLDNLLRNNLKKITVQRKKGTIQSFFKFLSQELPALINELPVLNSEKHKDYYSRAKTNNFTYDEWRDFRRVIENNPRTYILYVMVQTAMLLGGRRIGEILEIVWGDIDFSSSFIKIIPSKKRNDSTEYILPISKSLKLILAEYKKKSEYIQNEAKVFPNQTQQRVDSKIRYYAKKAGINKKISFHSIRTSFVTWANEQGHSQSEILNATLHSSAKMIRYYDKTEPLEVNSILKMRLF
jgi:integrase/recombinase XerD